MGVALAAVFFFLAGSCLYLASHGLEAATPWGAYSTLIGKIRAGGGDG